MAQGGRLADSRTGILAAESGDDAVEVLLGAEALAFQYFHDGCDLPHVGDRRFLDRDGVAFGAVVAHLDCGFHSRTGICDLGLAMSRRG